MAKKNIIKPKRELSKQQISQWEKERKRSRLIFTIGVAVIALVVAIVSVGWYINSYRPLHEKVIQVNDTSFTMGYYVDTLKYYANIYPANQLPSMASIIATNIEQSELLRQVAGRLGYTVSDEEAAKNLVDNSLPRTRAALNAERTALLVEKLRSDYFDPQVPQTAEQVQVQAMFLESQSQAMTVKAKLEAGDDFSALAEELSLEKKSKDAKGDLGWHPRSIFESMFGDDVTLADYVFSAELDKLSDPVRDSAVTKNVGYWLLKVTERKADTNEAHVFAMLLGSEEEANIVKNRLAAGEDFEAIAKDLSQLGTTGDAESKSDMGWVTAQSYPKAFDDYVFNPETLLNEVSAPIRDAETTTVGGYWLLKVTGKEADREIAQADRDVLITKLFTDWITVLNTDPSNVIDHSRLTTEKQIWALTRVMS